MFLSEVEKLGLGEFNAMLTGRKLITDTDILKIIIALDVDANALFSRKDGG